MRPLMPGMPPRVKVCGIRRLADATLAVELGAAAIGFVFWPGSARFIEPEAAGAIAAALPPGVQCVGVFVDQSAAHVAEVAKRSGITVVQLHGNEAVADYQPLGLTLIKAVPVPSAFDPSAVDRVPDAVTVLLDAHDPVRRGGTGRTIDWTAAADVAARRRTILSGGLTPGNVAEAAATVRPFMLDVSSGVESAPGEKDAAALRAFFAALARAAHAPAHSG